MSIDGENYLHPQNRTSPGGRLDSYPKKEIVHTKKHGGRFQRFDSGIGDIENSGSGEFPMQIPRSCSPRPFHYDYADYPSHQYEEVPIQTPSYNRDDSQLGRPMFHSSSDIPNEEENQSQSHSESSRKKVNPLYEAVSKNGYQQSCDPLKQPPVEAIHKQFVCLRAAFSLVVLVVLLSFIGLTTVILLNQPKENGNLAKELQDLKRKHSLLEWKLSVMTASQNSSESSLRVLDYYLNNRSEAIQVNFDTIQEMSASLNDTLRNFQTQIRNISKMPGPQGPRGVGDLSRCQYKKISDYSAQEVTSTVWSPTLNMLKTNVVMSASCSVSGGVSTLLEELNGQFQCKCSGQYPKNSRFKKCNLHLWLCPKTS
ncbi:uncharacterized protein LOC115217548 isoform X1 [Argonauta hians]